MACFGEFCRGWACNIPQKSQALHLFACLGLPSGTGTSAKALLLL